MSGVSDTRLERSTEVEQWFIHHYGQTGSVPTHEELEELQGPSKDAVIESGGILHIANVVGDGLHGRRGVQRELDEIMTDFTAWLQTRDQREAPYREDYLADYRDKNPYAKVSELTLRRKTGMGWREILEHTGLYRFSWDPSECVGFAREAFQKHPELRMREAMRIEEVHGVTPSGKDVEATYPDMNALTRQRLSWDTLWKKRERARHKELSTRAIASYGVLALCIAEGDRSNVAEAMNMMHKENRGPRYNRLLLSKIAPKEYGRIDGADFALDLIQEMYYDIAEDESARSRPSILDELPGIEPPISAGELILPVFMPEINESLQD